MQTRDSSSRSVFLDNLRGLAILGVLSVHAIYSVNEFAPHDRNDFFTYIAGLGKYGVELFFVISGALMFSIYGSSKKFDVKKYWARRILRIYPLWIIFLLIWLSLGFFYNFGGVHEVLIQTRGAQSSDFLLTFPGMFILGSTFTLFLSATLWNTVIPGGWSIQAEMFHYFCFAISRKLKFYKTLIILTFVNFITLILQSAQLVNPASHSIVDVLLSAWSRSGFYSSLSFFMLGMVLALCLGISSHKSVTSVLGEALEFKYWTLTLFFLSLILIPTPFGYTFEAIGFVVIMLAIGWLSITSGIASKLLSYIGKYSYFIYFVHFLILDLLVTGVQKFKIESDFLLSQKIYFVAFYLITLATSILLAIPSMKFFEKPFTNLSKPKNRQPIKVSVQKNT